MERFFDALTRKNIKDLAVIALEQQGYTEAAKELAESSRLTEAAIRRTKEALTTEAAVAASDIVAEIDEDIVAGPDDILTNFIAQGNKAEAKARLKEIKDTLDKSDYKTFKKQIKAI